MIINKNSGYAFSELIKNLFPSEIYSFLKNILSEYK